jgi:hypothetical protein
MACNRTLRSAAVFLAGLVPMMLVFAAHECASTGFFLSHRITCDSTVGMFTVAPVWSRMWLVVFYGLISRYCILIESPVCLIKA